MPMGASDAILGFFAQGASAFLLKLASSIDDVVWFACFLTPNLSVRQRCKNVSIYVTVCLLQTVVAFLISTSGEEAVDALTKNQAHAMSAEKILSLVAALGLSAYSVHLANEELKERFDGNACQLVARAARGGERGSFEKADGGDDDHHDGDEHKSSRDAGESPSAQRDVGADLEIGPLQVPSPRRAQATRQASGRRKYEGLGARDDDDDDAAAAGARSGELDDDEGDLDARQQRDLDAGATTPTLLSDAAHVSARTGEIELSPLQVAVVAARGAAARATSTNNPIRARRADGRAGADDADDDKLDDHHSDRADDDDDDAANDAPLSPRANPEQQNALFVVAFCGSLDDLTLFVPMLVGGSINFLPLVCGSMFAVCIIVTFCVFLNYFRRISDFLQSIPLVVITSIFATFLIVKVATMD